MKSLTTVFAQLIHFVPKEIFNALAKIHHGPRAERVFTRWDQFVHLLYIQLSGVKTLRGSIDNIAPSKHLLYPLRAKPVARSTFADANKSRPYTFFEALAHTMYERCVRMAFHHSMPFKYKLFSLDASTVGLNFNNFAWAKFRSTKSGIKLHTLLDHDGEIPKKVIVTEACHHECKVAKKFNFPKGSIIVFDKGFIDYEWFRQLIAKGVHFVTRLKYGADYIIMEHYPADPEQGILKDQLIQINSTKNPLYVRHIRYYDKERNREYDFISSLLTEPAKVISNIYKERWKVQTFFRYIKQNLKIKSFIGTSKNAVLSQVYVALIAYLLAAWQKFLSTTKRSCGSILRMIQNNIFKKCRIDELWMPKEKLKLLTSEQYTLFS